MPSSILKPCSHPGCRELVSTGSRCAAHQSQQRREQDARRDPATRALYNTPQWRRARAAYLAQNPLCVRCGGLSEVVDHIRPHRGNYAAFWDAEGNWQALCKRCHDRKTATEDGAFGRPRIDSVNTQLNSAEGESRSRIPLPRTREA